MGRVEHLGVEFNSHGGRDVMVQRGVGVCEASDQTSFSHAGIAEHNDFVERGLRRCGSGSVRHALLFVS